MLLLNVLLASAAVVTLVPVTVLFTEVLVAATSRHRAAPDATARPALAVLMPARNEEAIIVATLAALIPQLRKSDRVIVIADNCSDRTAALAASAGAEVLVRHDEVRRGKGYAVDYGVRQLATSPPEVVVILDADCRIEAQSLDRLVTATTHSGRPAQALYLMQTPHDASVLMRIAAFAWIVKTYVRPLGMHRLGLPCQLMGTGMAFPWACISTAPLATALTADDLKLGIDLALAGTPALFCPQAKVRSSLPDSNEGLHGQRIRWEHGHLDVALRDGPRLLGRALGTRNLALLALGLDLCVPPLALLLLLVVALWCASAVLRLISGAGLALALSTIAIVLLFVSVLLARRRFARGVISLRDLAWAGAYALWKIPLYLRFLRTRQSDWVGSKRD